MDNAASVLLAFPPDGDLPTLEKYHKAVTAHVQQAERLLKDTTTNLASLAPLLLEHVNPAVNSISYLALLQSILASEKTTQPQRLAVLPRVTAFFMTFDPRQIRYVGSALSRLLDLVASNELLPVTILRLNPAGSMLTSHHLSLVSLAYETNNIEPALPVLEKTIVFYPGVKGAAAEKGLLGDPALALAAYLTPESGLTAKLSSSSVLRYDLLCGLCFIQRRMWQQAFDALERVVTYPTKDLACSKIMVDAHNKWVLVGLLLTGKMPALPPTTSQPAQKTYATLGKAYTAIGKAFEKLTAETIKAEVFSLGQYSLAEEGNLGLMQLVLSHYQRWQIVNLGEAYTKISLEQIRAQTQSAETGAPLETEAEIEALVESMIGDGMLHGVIEKPAPAEEGDDGTPPQPAYLHFLSPADDLSEQQFAAQMLAAAQRIKDLGPIVKAASERLGTRPEYLRYLVQEQKRDKDGSGPNSAAMGFELTFDDEDLMTGVTAGI
ncbi:hypothetical protein B0T26DRAFT_636879 [Lasiosphaeria miniovina]|uniref:COP9 signalosome complex subunit 3 N-terminal helical repeats domain-containing protein n=1 Tax=Lasiosphaeria miniovina TaxID=1954250 RepID=A0AA40B684_9PEZI|nr:uncharacterized protein B0T26DRAFT_636879 [Lasiosphaeria miniovina]KAK0728442.1 hypothetical protein B0T26DRAFT_636879 [Lasiosphaeria miniovina]